MGAWGTLAGGLLGLTAALGVGCGFTHLLGSVPKNWRLAISLVSGVAIIEWAVMVGLFLGGGVHTVRAIGAFALILGIVLLLRFRKNVSFLSGLGIQRKSDFCFAGVIGIACAINLCIAVAPSTKIDELHYHMLIPKRVMEDNGLYLYRLPYESAIFPQTGYQLGLTAEHAAGFPEAGNVVSWGLGVALILLVAGVTASLTGSSTAGWMTGAISAVGLYPAVWHVSSGPHSFGDLSTVTACLLALLPDKQPPELSPKARLVLTCLAAYAASSTKISILPVTAAITLIAVYRAAGDLGWKTRAGIAAAVWGVFYGPIIGWTTLKCRSPWGLATATLFHSHYFGTGPIEILRGARAEDPLGWLHFWQWMAPSFSIGMMAAFAIVAYAAVRREWASVTVCGLVCGQAIVIMMLLPHQFRFLGGLEYVVFVVGSSVFWNLPFGKRASKHWAIILVLFCLPWVAVQVYYARPFLKFDLGLTNRETFCDEFVAYSGDFRALDKLLPSDAVLAVDERIPSFYAPRPVVFTADDLRGRKPVYVFTLNSDSDMPMESLTCTKSVYKDPEAVVEVYRTPGRLPQRGSLQVKQCEVTVPLPISP
jgi:hypothetical protein